MDTRRLGVFVLVVAMHAMSVAADEPADEFRKHIVPILRNRCFRCHEGRDAKAGIRLDLRAELLGETGRDQLVTPGKSSESRILELIQSKEPAERMPPESPALTAEEIAHFRKWIDDGLPWDSELLPETESVENHWSFQPVRRPEVPDDPSGWSRTPVDEFIAAKHRLHGLTPSQEASRRNLIRRLSLDLWGLPPTWQDVEAFVSDARPDAYQRQVERLLADRRYGERWGRHWLDVARWAESEGFESNHPRPFAWRYRDYVTQAFHEDLPFDQFLIEQLAGDELPEYSDRHLIATGFLAAARISSNEEDKWLQRNDVIVDIVNTVGSGLLGLTWHCAQCHDHKFDPISAQDYYALHAFFVRGMPLNVAFPENRDATASARPPEYELAVTLRNTILQRARDKFVAETRQQLTPEELHAYDLPLRSRSAEEEVLARQIDLRFQKTEGSIEKRIPPEDKKLFDELKKRIQEWDANLPAIPQTFAFFSPITSPHSLDVLPSQGFYPLPYDPSELRDLKTYVMTRGDVHRIGDPVNPAFPHVLQAADDQQPRGRLELARWMTRADQPLVPRVWVNRVWQYHFGRGLVATTDDFGLRGARPTHSDLLDWLTSEFLDHAWSTKHLHRLIVNSAVYRQSAEVGSARVLKDPENRWLARWNPRRMEAEVLRDSWLAVTGELDLQFGGQSIPLEQRETSHRRSLYLIQRRGDAPDVQRLFDGPQECAESLARREVTISPLQGLYLLNSEFSVERAKTLAQRLEAKETEPEQLIRVAFQEVLLRAPNATELAAAQELWAATQESSPLELLCQALLNLNEFHYVD